MQGSGFLAIWSDLSPEDEVDWSHWITREHAAERLGVDGFLACRIFRAAGTLANRYFILYDLKGPEVIGSASYLARLNAPTPWSQRIMPRLRNFVRGGGRVAASAGHGQGGVLAVVPLATAPGQPEEIATELAAMDRIVAARVLVTDEAQTSIQTREKGMRSDDRSFSGLLLVEGLNGDAVRNAVWRAQQREPACTAGVEHSPLYTSIFSLNAS
jgi:hypothetical protein